MTLYLVLGGLLILTLVLASIAQRYHAYIEERRRRIERVLQKVSEIEGILHRMRGLPVPVEAEEILRKEVLERLSVVKSVHSRHPGIDKMIAEAEQALSAVEPGTASLDLDEVQLATLIITLGEVLWMGQEGRFASELPEQDKIALMQVCAMRRAECLNRFHRREGEQKRRDGQLNQALWHYNQICKFIRENGPEDDRVRSWYRQAEETHREILLEINGHADESSSE
ncbi:MAG: hypothetical protein KZQ93_11740 [Candidatus Thiodiazotropha sp. (ex Monitilora ramsayi)]|nr:hypothetical protein [Candidatus Thiodiazotropha sp. (ex Monitilora ramsayi)]